MTKVDHDTPSRRWTFIKIVLILVAVFQVTMILNYHYGMTKYIYVKSPNIISSTPRNSDISVRHNDTINYTYVQSPHSISSSSVAADSLDIHTQDGTLGHTWSGHHTSHNDTASIVPNSIAVGMGIISTKNRYGNAKEMSATFPFFKRFLPTFCKTASIGFRYNFFLAYDVNDACFTNIKNLTMFKDLFQKFVSINCSKKSTYSLHFVQCTHKGAPARAQNDAMMEAYMSNMEYYYRVNDDTNLDTSGWTEDFIKTLKGYNPPNVGVVGPRAVGGNINILTYDFVHHTHVNIFGFYYPRVFTGWYADDWVTDVYKPDRSTKLNISVTHTFDYGTRYRVDYALHAKKIPTVKESQKVLNRYLTAVNTKLEQPLGDKVISMSLSGKNPRYTFGAIRNAQLLPVYFPGWNMRIYIPDAENKDSVPVRVLNKLKLLGVELVVIKSEMEKISSDFWKYLIINDDTVKYFLVSNTDYRFSDKYQLLTKEWIKEGSAGLCIKDMKQHENLNFVDGLIGGKNLDFKNKIGENINVSILKNQTNVNQFLDRFMWPKLKNDVICYDTVSVNSTRKRIIINVQNQTELPLGTVFDEFGQKIKF